MGSGLVLIIIGMLLGAPGGAASEPSSDTKSLTVTATFGSRTSLRVSTQLLEFDVRDSGEVADAIVDFSAGVRTRAGGPVFLTVELVTPPDGEGDMENAASITVADDEEGVTASPVSATGASVAARWHGSGRRSGRLVFSLRASAPGPYAVPVRFALSAP